MDTQTRSFVNDDISLLSHLGEVTRFEHVWQVSGVALALASIPRCWKAQNSYLASDDGKGTV